MEGKAAVLGSSDFVMPFSALGMDTFAVGDGADEAIERAKEIIEGNYGLVLVAENVAGKVSEIFEAVQKNATPCVVVVPFTEEATGIATKSLGEALRMATGINILKNN